jgi:Na+-driven multidrug efflux pump
MDMTEAIAVSVTLGALAVASTIFSKRHQYERWAKIALVMWACDAVAWCVSVLIQSSIRGTHNRWYPLVSHLQSIFAGAGLSLMVLLLLSGQLNNPRPQLTPEQRLAIWWRGVVIGLILTAVVIIIFWRMTFWRS